MHRPPSLERFLPLAEKKAACTRFSLRLLIKSAGDFGGLQLCLGVPLLYLPHPWRISGRAVLSTLMNTPTVSERGAVSAGSEQ